MKALIVADGHVPARARLDAAWPDWSARADLVIAADGGAVGAERLGLALSLVVGDMDSLDPDRLAALRASGVEIELAPAAKDESDTELAVRAALVRGADALTIVGAFGGGRFDHALANVALLTLPTLVGRTVELVDESTRVTLVRAPDPSGHPVDHPLAGRVGDIVSLLPYGGDAEGVTTVGLRFPLHDERLPAGPARGLSNVRLAPDASITLRSGLLLIVESPATLSQ